VEDSSSLGLRALVYGRVQGVAFRYNTKLRAEELGLNGWVRNTPEGTVEALAQGRAEDIEKFKEFLKVGTHPAKVEKVEFSKVNPSDQFSSFKIIR
jgi:acylphosphatase